MAVHHPLFEKGYRSMHDQDRQSDTKKVKERSPVRAKNDMKSLKELFVIGKQAMERHQDFVFVTVIASSGSSPRGAGSRMLVLPDGTSHGTVGGGNVEYHAIQQAKEVLVSKKSFSKGYHLHAGETADLGMICGGDVVIYFQYMSWENEEFYRLCCQLLEDWDKNESSWLIMDITDETAWAAGYYSPEHNLIGLSLTDLKPLLQTQAVQAVINGRRYYSEPLVRQGIVYVFGGGHVAQELVPLLSHLDFRCVLYDDREAFSNPSLFPDAARCITGDFSDISQYVTIQPQDYVCIMTRGHQSDYILQQQILKTDAHYIGVMGSRKKSAAIRQKLLDDGFTGTQIDRINTPIGLSILAETPAEIAVSIAAQLVMIRARKK